MKTMTVHNTPSEVAEALARSIQNEHRDNGLGRFAGTWTEEQFREFETTQAPFNEVDEGIWS